MAKDTKRVDASGTPLAIGDAVQILRIPEWLLKGLPNEDQVAIKDMAGTAGRVTGWDTNGNAEVENKDRLAPRTIWIEPSCLRRI